MTRVAVWVAVVLAFGAAATGCGEGKDESPTVASQVGPQLGYLEAGSSAVVAVDLRFDAANWRELRPLVSRMLRAYRAKARGPERLEVPANVEGALAMLSSFGGLSFEDDVRPALDGHLVVGLVQSARSAGDREAADARMTLVYRSREGDLRRIAQGLADGDRLERLRGHDDVVLLDDSTAIVGRDTLVLVDGPGRQRRLLEQALSRARERSGFPVERLAAAERDAGLDDPLVVGFGDLRLAGALLDERQLPRLRRQVPYVRAVRRAAVAVDVSAEQGITAIARVVTDPAALRDEHLPVGERGELEVPADERSIVGGSRNQSRTTTLLSRAVRTAYADSRFARAVRRAERDLGIDFEAEVLRQFSCPSISVLEPAGRGPQRFAARSCVRDPDRMRRLLPRLRPHLPAIIKGLQGLGDEGLAGLLLVAPDAPLTPSALGLAQIVVRPLNGIDGRDRDQLYEISGLHDDTTSELALAGPERVIFGLIGDAFVVASDRRMARRITTAPTRKLEDPAGAAILAPLHAVLGADGGPEIQAIASVLPRVETTVSASREATTIRSRLPTARGR